MLTEFILMHFFADLPSPYFLNGMALRYEIKSFGKNSILNSLKIAGQTPRPSLYPKGKFLMLTEFILMHCYLKLTPWLVPPPPLS